MEKLSENVRYNAHVSLNWKYIELIICFRSLSSCGISLKFFWLWFEKGFNFLAKLTLIVYGWNFSFGDLHEALTARNYWCEINYSNAITLKLFLTSSQFCKIPINSLAHFDDHLLCFIKYFKALIPLNLSLKLLGKF